VPEFTAPDVAATATAPAARPEPDAIGVAQNTVTGLAPGVPVGLTLAALAAASAYAGGWSS
jgi:hypothetical protein